MGIKFDIEEEKFPMVLHVAKGQEAVLDWRLPSLGKERVSEKQIPVILIGMANEQEDKARYLRNLPKELNEIREALKRPDQEGLCRVEIIQNAAIEEIFDAFLKWKDQIAVFHYAGHADGFQLMLESAYGEEKDLVDFLKEQKELKLVFLSGCASPEQAKKILEYGVPIVIATYSEIQDEAGIRFAEDFYKNLANGISILEAFERTEAMMNLMLVKGKSDDLPWEMIIREGAEEASEWRLPVLSKTEASEELSGFHDLRWNDKERAWEMQYGAVQGMPDTPWNFALMELDIYPLDQNEPLFGGRVVKVFDSLSLIQPEGSLDTGKIYRTKIKEAAPSQIVNIFQKGTEREIQRFEELYKPKASPYLQFVNTETVADYTLEINEQEWLLFEPNEETSDGKELIFGVEKAVEDWAINELLENLSKIVRWRQMLGFTNEENDIDKEIKIELQRTYLDGEIMTTYKEHKVEIDLEEENLKENLGGFRLNAQNIGKQELHIRVYLFSSSFEIRELEVTSLLPGSGEVILYEEKFNYDLVKSDSIISLKVFIYDHITRTWGFEQNGINLGRIIGPTRNLERSQTRQLPNWPANMNWTEQTFTIHLKAKPAIEESYTQTVKEAPIQQQQSKKARPKTIRSRIINWREVQQLVSKGQTEKALDLALELAERYDRKRLYENLIVLKSRQEKLRKDVNMGIISREEEQIEQARITTGLLDMTNEGD